MKETTITTRQHEYVLALRDGPKTTHDLVLDMMVSGNSIAKAMRGLREVGLVESTTLPGGGRGRIFVHCLAGPYKALMRGVVVVNRAQQQIRNEDIDCALDLRLKGCTGQELCAEFRKVRGERSDGAIKNIVNKARRRKEWH